MTQLMQATDVCFAANSTAFRRLPVHLPRNGLNAPSYSGDSSEDLQKFKAISASELARWEPHLRRNVVVL